MPSQQSTSRKSSDSSLQICVQAVLLLQRRSTLRNVRVHVEGDAVELSGTVPTFYDRQVAVTACRRVEGVRELRDRIEVVAPGSVASCGDPSTVDTRLEASSDSSRSRLVAPQVHATAGDAGWAVPLRIVLALVLVWACGCQEASTPRQTVFPVKGQVLFKDKPLENALVVLHPKTPGAPGVLPARATTDREGNFQVATYDAKDGAIAGEYVITVQHFPLVKKGESFEPGPNALPPKLAKPETSNLPVVTVADGPVDVGVLKIKG
jgi:hypothetical protein